MAGKTLNIRLTDYDAALIDRFPIQPAGKARSIFYKRWNPQVRGRMIEAYAQGASDAEVCALLGVSLHTLDNWVAGNITITNRWEQAQVIDLVKTIYAGRLQSQAWWERQGRQNLQNRNFNAPLWNTNMTNRYGWNSSKTEERVIVSHEEKVDVDAILERWRDSAKGAIDGEVT